MPHKIIFLDTETDGLGPDRKVWELGMVVRQDGKDREHHWFFDISLENSDPFALNVGGYWARHPNPFRETEQ